MKLELIATAAFGLEAVVRREIEALGFRVTKREDGRVTFITNESGLARSNIWLRSADRVLLKMGEFHADAFEHLFQGMKAIEWETLLPPDAAWTVNCSSVKSKLSSTPACQSVAEKALIERLSEIYGIKRFEKSGAAYKIGIRLLRDTATISVDTSGAGLHKRGYREHGLDAPIKETLAAAMVNLSFWKRGRLLVNPCCGSGTIAIEAAMIGNNIAPGLGRKFAAEAWGFVPPEIWKREKSEAYKLINMDGGIRIYASDISKRAVEAAIANAENAGVEDSICFEQKPFAEIRAEEQSGIIVCNPPYGERVSDKESAAQLYREFGAFMQENKTWSLFLITTDREFEQTAFGRPADRRRKLYNGRLETTFYQYHGERPSKETERRAEPESEQDPEPETAQNTQTNPDRT
jgi:putative N6-adenine-specific DNA methylase